jgi:hypothetical protein
LAPVAALHFVNVDAKLIKKGEQAMTSFPKKITYPATLIVLFAGAVLGGIICGYLSQPKEACAQCFAVGGRDTGSLNGTAEGSAAETTLIGLGCVKLNNEDAGYGINIWMACPTGYYMAAVTDDWPAEQDAFCCRLMP